MGVQPGIRQVGKYTVLDVIGTGGMGIVYRANDPTIGRTVAIKMLRESESPGGIFDRFFSREMKSTGNLHHRNIVTVYDTGLQDGKPYLVMEYLEGEPTSKLISERRPLPLVEKLDLVIQVCDGLQYAHDRNIIHRDIKPANVIVLTDGTAKIVDFGVARNAGVESTTMQTGQLVGSLSYMSPEQINSIPVDARSDVFSTGVMLYELLTYHLPFKGDDVASTFVKILREEPKPLAQFGTDFPPGLQAVVSRALAKNVNDRYQTAEEFGFDLLSVQKVLKAASIADCMKWAEAAAQRGDLERARVHLQEVIRLDRQNERANRLVREVRRAIQQQQRTSQVIQMRSQAQVALAGAQYEEALACADQALRLDPTDAESIKLCDEIRNAISRVKAVREALNRAESALLAGDFDEAKEAVEESLRLDATDSEARALASVINTELGERSRRQRVQVFVDQARREIAERKFSDALDVLHQAEELDPSESNVRELLKWALRGHEQEKKRLFLQEITDQIEKALHAGDFTSACTISEMGLSQFPDEPTLARLRAISEKQRDIAERRRFVNEQSLAVKALSEQGKLQEAVQLLTKGLAKYRSEPNLESLLANTRLEIERIEFERQEVERQHALERAEAEARAQLTQEVLNRSVELRRSLDARSEIGELRRTAQQLRASMEGQHIDEHAIEVAEAVLDEVDLRLRARDQALAELEQLRRVVERPHDTTILGESENRLLSINAAFPHEPQVQQISAELAANLSRLREERDGVLASLTTLVRDLDRTQTGDLTELFRRAREIATGFAGDAQIGALLQQVESTVTKRMERHTELLGEIAGLSTSLGAAHSLEDLSRTLERAKSIAAQDAGDPDLADRARQIESDVARLRTVIDGLLHEMDALAQAVVAAPTVVDAEALTPRIKSLVEKRADFQELQEAAKRILTGIQGRRMEHDLIVQELESLRSSLPVLESDQELEAAAARAEQCLNSHPNDPTVRTIAIEIERDVEQLLRERAEVRSRTLECDNALQLAEENIRSGDWESALNILLPVEGRNPERADLRLQITVARKALDQQRAEQESIENERIARERAEAEVRAREAAIQQVIQTAWRLLSEERLDDSAQYLRDALTQYPGDGGLQSALASVEMEAARRRAEREQQVRERQEREALDRTRKTAADQAISEAQQLLAQDRGEESVQRLRTALERDAANSDLQAALLATQNEIERRRAEVRERERQEQLAREKAAAEARQRNEAAEQAIRDASKLLAKEQEDQALQLLRNALDRDPANAQLTSKLKLMEAEAARAKGERERQEREALERARKTAAEQAISEAKQLLAQGHGEQSVQRLRTALERDAANSDLRAALLATQNEIERRRAEVERERERQEQLAREKAAAEARQRNEAAEQAIRDASKLLAQEQEDQALQLLRTALVRDPANAQLTSTLKSMEAEVTRVKSERERLEREVLERARKTAADQAMSEAKQLLAQDHGEESVQRLRTALERDAANSDLRAALLATQNEIERRRAEVVRERERQEQLAREKAAAEARQRNEAAEQAIRDARKLLAQEQEDQALELLRTALDRDPANAQLTSTIKLMEAEVTRAKGVRERLARERLAREQAEAQERVRKAAAQHAVDQARALHAQGESVAAIELLQAAIGRDPQSVNLPAALESIQTDLARQRAEQERRERERVERELQARNKAEAEERARKQAAELAIRESRELLARKRTEESLQRLNSALKQDPENGELQAALVSTQAEVARQKSEQDRLEKERQERERQAREQADREARARKAAADKAIKEAKDLLTDGLGEEAVEKLRKALEYDNKNSELTAALQAAEAEFRRIKEEKKRQEKERKKQEKLDREQLQAKEKRAATDKAPAVMGKAEAGEAAASISETASAKRAAGEPAVHPQAAAARRNRLIGAGAAVAAVLAVGAFFVFRSGSSAELPVTFQIAPTDAQMTVDGNATDCAATCTVHMKPGKHTITLQKHGYPEQTQSIEIADSDTNRTIALALKQSSGATNPQVPQPPPQEAEQAARVQPPAPPVTGNNRQTASTQQRPSQNQVPVPQPVQPQGPQVASPPPPAPAQIPADVTAWNKVKDTHNVEALRDFRKNFPTSQFAREANEKMEETTWTSVHDSSQLADFQRYINDYPDGRHVAEARDRVRAIEKAQEAAKAQEVEKAQALQQTQQQAQKQAQQRDHDLVLQTLDAYRRAYEAKDVNALSAVWITAPRQNLEKVFKLADKIRVGLTPESVTISGDTATISCHQRLEVTATSKNVNERLVVFSLKKQQGKWVIDSAK